MNSESVTRLASRMLPTLRRWAVGGLTVCATAAPGFAAASSVVTHQQPLTVTVTNLNGTANGTTPGTGKLIYDVTIDSVPTDAKFGQITGSQPLSDITQTSTKGRFFDALVWAPNSKTASLDLIAADVANGKIVRYAGPKYGDSIADSGATVIYPSPTSPPPGPAFPTGVAADSAGNVFVISPNSHLLGQPELWVLPFDGPSGNYLKPVRIDNKFGSAAPGTAVLLDVIVAGADAGLAPSSTTPAWRAHDLLVLLTDSKGPRVVVYSRNVIYQDAIPSGTFTTPFASYSLPVGTPGNVVTASQFKNHNSAIPVSMDIWQAGSTYPAGGTGASLMFATLGGKLIDFNPGQGSSPGFVPPNFVPVDFATGLGAGLQKLRVGVSVGGTAQNPVPTPYAFVAQVNLSTNGKILQYGVPSTAPNTTPFATLSGASVNYPTGLAVSTSSSVSTSQCIGTQCTILGGGTSPELALQITPPPGTPSCSTDPTNVYCTASILDKQCTPIDPRVTTNNCPGEGCTWMCGKDPTTGLYTLDVQNLPECGADYPHTIVPAHLCGHSGPNGNQFVVVKGTAQTSTGGPLAPFTNNAFFTFYWDASQVLPSPTFDLQCVDTGGNPTWNINNGILSGNSAVPALPIFAYAPRSDLQQYEGVTAEQGSAPYPPYIDTNGACAGGTSGSKHEPMFLFGVGLNPSGFTDGIFGGDGVSTPFDPHIANFVDAKFKYAARTIDQAVTNGQIVGGYSAGTPATTLKNGVLTAQSYFEVGAQYSDTNSFNCALSTLATADGYLRTNLTSFLSPAQVVPAVPVPPGNPNTAGDLDTRFANAYLSVANYFLNFQNTQWNPPVPPAPACNNSLAIAYYTISSSDTYVSTGKEATRCVGRGIADGNPIDEVNLSLGPNNLPVLSSAEGCGILATIPLSESGEITYWSPALNSNVTQSNPGATSVVTLPLDRPTFYPPNGTGHSDGANGYQAAVLSGHLIVPADTTITFTIDADDWAFVYVDGQNVCDLGGLAPLTSGFQCVSPTITAGTHTLQVFFADVQITGSGLYFGVPVTLNPGVVITPF